MMKISELRKKLDEKQVSAVELTREYLKKIEDNVALGAFNTVCAERALEDAKRADKKIAEGDAAPLTGIPLAIKDNICTRGVRTTCSSKFWRITYRRITLRLSKNSMRRAR